MKKLATTAAVLATVIAVCFAALQVGGRALCWQLPRLESSLNRLFAPHGIAVRGLEGRWHGLNFGFFAQWARFPAGEASGVDFELDVVESLVRNRLVARRFTVADGHLVFEKTSDGWRLRGAQGANVGDANALLLHSDEVWLRGRLVARDDHGREAVVHVEAMLINQGGEHRFHVGAQSEPNCNDCALTVDGTVQEAGAGAVRATATRFSLGRELETILGAPAALPGAGGVGKTVLTVDGDWRRDADGTAKAQLTVAADVPSPTGGEPARLQTHLTAWSAGAGYRGRIARLFASSGDAATELADGGFRLDAVADGPLVDVWLPEVDIAALAAATGEFVGDERESGRWLRRLAPGGEVRDVLLRVDRGGLAYHGRGVDGRLAGHKGVPKLANADFVFGGHAKALRLRFTSRPGRPLTLAFPNFFPRQDPFESAGGVLTFAFAPGHLGLRGTGFWGEQSGTRGVGGFAWARPGNPLEARVSADFAFDHARLALARAYLPLTLQPGLRRWLQDGVRGGVFQDGRLVYHGHVKRESGASGSANDVRKRALRRMELAARIVDGALDYHPDWPPVSAFEGALLVAHERTRLQGRGRVFDTALAELEVDTPRTAPYTRVRFAGAAPAERVLRFVRATPTRAAMPFLSDAWSAQGAIDFRADLKVPLRGQELAPGDIRLDMRLRDAMADLADLGLRFEQLRGRVNFAAPHHVSTPSDAPLEGSLFGAPARLAFASDDEAVRVTVAGSADTADALRLLGADDVDMVAGKAGFDATLTVSPASGRAPELAIESGLEGVAVTLPTPLGKVPQEALPTRVAMRFLDDHIAVSMRYGEARGWLRLADGRVRSGALGIGASIPVVNAAGGRVVIGGQLNDVDAHTVAALLAAPDAEESGFAWELRKFRVRTLALESARLHDVVLNGFADDGDAHFDVRGRELEGTVTKAGDAPWQLRLDVLRLPDPGDDHRLSPDVIDRLVDADVTIGEVRIGDANYGKWAFGLRPEADGVTLLGIEASDVRGLDIVATAPAFWSKAGETSFAGIVRSRDVRGALAAWEFAPSVEAERFEADGELRWPGAPFDFALAHITGNATLRLDTGRFLTVEPGGGRIMSLINFSEILRRMRLDFSDVFGRGSDFDRVYADLVVDDGLAHFAKPAEIRGSAASFRIGGTVDLDTGALDNEMIVTVSVLHRNLPWYAAFLAFSNPASAAGVLLGSQVLFKDQIKQFSSGKYAIGGTYEDPEVKFIGIWRDDIAAPVIPPDDGKLAPQAMARRNDVDDEADTVDSTPTLR